MTLRFTITALLGASALLDGQIRGPMLGFVWDGRQEAIRPVLGIAGSSTLGHGVSLDFAVKQTAISPNQDFAIVLGGDARTAYWVDLRPTAPVSRRIDGVPDGASRLVLSTSATAAAVLAEDARKIYVLTGLPQNPAVARTIELASDGAPAVFAVSDDGALVAAGYPDQRTLVTIDENSNFLRLPDEMAVRSLAFLENSREALVAADRGVFRVSGNAISGTLHDAPNIRAVASAAGGKRALLADGDSAAVIEVVIESGERRQVDCPCVLSAVSRMGAGIFRLNEISSAPLWLVEVADSGLRTLFVPDPEGN